ncbi:MAG: hypothetical protein AAF242_06290 [Bacteroidota bacterium]
MEQQYEQIEQYLAGTLTGAELKAFEQALKDDPAFAKEVALHQMTQAFLAQGDELDLRQNLEMIGAEIDLDKNKDSDSPNGNGGFNLNMLWLLFGFTFFSVAVTFYALNKSENRTTVEEANLEDSTQAAPSLNAPTQVQTADSLIEEEVVPSTDNISTNNQAEEPIATRNPLETLAPLEALLDPAQQSKVLEFANMQASTNPLNDQTNLIIEGELYTAIATDSIQLEIRVYNNDPRLYPTRPLLQSPIIPRLLEEEEVIAFAAKQVYSILYDELLDLESGLYYFQFIQINDSTPLYTGKFVKN